VEPVNSGPISLNDKDWVAFQKLGECSELLGEAINELNSAKGERRTVDVHARLFRAPPFNQSYIIPTSSGLVYIQIECQKHHPRFVDF